MTGRNIVLILSMAIALRPDVSEAARVRIAVGVGNPIPEAAAYGDCAAGSEDGSSRAEGDVN